MVMEASFEAAFKEVPEKLKKRRVRPKVVVEYGQQQRNSQDTYEDPE
jgi:hypothetical protein